VDAEYIRELFSEFDIVHVRRMFGGAGLYSGGVMFGLVSDGQIYLKADAVTAARFQSEGCVPFEYDTRNGKRALASYWRLPDRLYDDPTELAQWAKLAFGVGRKSAADRSAKTQRESKKEKTKKTKR